MPASYSITEHSISEAGAQGVEGAWLVRLGFLLFGFAVLGSASLASSRWGPWGSLFHRLFGALMFGAAAFSQRSWEQDAPFDEVEDALHAAMAAGIGLAFTVGVLIVMLRRGPGARWGRLFDGAAVVAASVVPMFMLNVTGIAGLVQRVMFGVAYLWHGVEAATSLVTRSPAGDPTGLIPDGRRPGWAPMSRTTRRVAADPDPDQLDRPVPPAPPPQRPERGAVERLDPGAGAGPGLGRGGSQRGRSGGPVGGGLERGGSGGPVGGGPERGGSGGPERERGESGGSKRGGSEGKRSRRTERKERRSEPTGRSRRSSSMLPPLTPEGDR
jgi:hypothetical protein